MPIINYRANKILFRNFPKFVHLFYWQIKWSML
jgi:hypothetical protein